VTNGAPSIDLNSAMTAAAEASVARKIAELQRPEFVTQRTVLAVVGMTKRHYLDHVRAGDWPSWADGQLRYSSTADVVAWLHAHPVTVRSLASVASNDTDAEARAFARVGARRVAK
jgi:hypothetical protein